MCYLQDGLNKVVDMWNNHYIRMTHNDSIVHGFPSQMYFAPETYGTEDCLVRMDTDKLQVCVESGFCVGKPEMPCRDEGI